MIKYIFSILAFVCCCAMIVSSCQKELYAGRTVEIPVVNPGFEDSLHGWTVETTYVGIYGFQSSVDAVRTGKYGLNFYAAKPADYPGAPLEVPWNGKIYQTITGLADGTYTFKVYADATGAGMFLWANGGGTDVIQPFKSTFNELNTLNFIVKGGIAKFGFICINADSNGAYLSPYFHADDVSFFTKPY